MTNIIHNSVFLSEEEAISRQPKDVRLRALQGKAIVWFLPYRRTGEGVIELPEKFKDQSVEALIISDATGYKLDPGTKVIVSRFDGEYFEVNGVRLCRVDKKALTLIDTEHSPQYREEAA